MEWFNRFNRKQPTTHEMPAIGKAQHQILSGRPYLTNVPYAFPKDEEEVRRLDFQHHLVRHILNGNSVVPLATPRAILDIGCGTGRWSVEMAQQFSHARVIGLDIEPPTAETSESLRDCPPNCSFVPQNILEGLPFHNLSFDLTHQRFLYTAIPAQYWPTMISEMYRVTRAGGWVELVEGEIIYGGGPAINMLQQWGLAALKKRGIDTLISAQLGDLLQHAGFDHVAIHRMNIPMGSYAGRVGAMMERNLLAVLHNLRGPILALHLTTERKYNETFEQVRSEIEQARGKCAWTFYVTYGQRLS